MSTELPPHPARPRERRYLRDWLRNLPPRWLFRFVAWLGFKPPPMKALFDASSFMLSQWMYVAAKLKLADRLFEQPRTTQELAEACGVSRDRLGRMLYALEQRGYFRRLDAEAEAPLEGPWVNTALSSTLMASHPNSVRPLVLHWVEDCYMPNGHLLESLKKETSAFSLEKGEDYHSFFGDFLPVHPDKAALFSEAMNASSAFSDEAVLRDFSWSRFKRIVDVGGGYGSFLNLALERNAQAQGLVFDLPEVIQGARGQWSERDDSVSQRIAFSEGSFFEEHTIPKIGEDEVYVLRNVLHDWPDEESLQILKNLRQSMDPKGRLVLVELGMMANGRKHVLEQARSSVDMLMMSMFEGRERTQGEFEALLNGSGFELVQVKETRSPSQVIEARPVG
ncbi:MAG: methyltransferase [Myxococcota bacterium]|nr:methyltransferase [Myxococcota bacterium]